MHAKHTPTHTYQMFLDHLLVFLVPCWVSLTEFGFQLPASGCPSSFWKPGVHRCRNQGCCLTLKQVREDARQIKPRKNKKNSHSKDRKVLYTVEYHYLQSTFQIPYGSLLSITPSIFTCSNNIWII